MAGNWEIGEFCSVIRLSVYRFRTEERRAHRRRWRSKKRQNSSLASTYARRSRFLWIGKIPLFSSESIFWFNGLFELGRTGCGSGSEVIRSRWGCRAHAQLLEYRHHGWSWHIDQCGNSWLSFAGHGSLFPIGKVQFTFSWGCFSSGFLSSVYLSEQETNASLVHPLFRTIPNHSFCWRKNSILKSLL